MMQSEIQIIPFEARIGVHIVDTCALFQEGHGRYEPVGFVHTPRPIPSVYERANVYKVIGQFKAAVCQRD